jgi:hypothetical protein
MLLKTSAELYGTGLNWIGESCFGLSVFAARPNVPLDSADGPAAAIPIYREEPVVMGFASGTGPVGRTRWLYPSYELPTPQKVAVQAFRQPFSNWTEQVREALIPFSFVFVFRTERLDCFRLRSSSFGGHGRRKSSSQ